MDRDDLLVILNSLAFLLEHVTTWSPISREANEQRIDLITVLKARADELRQVL